jgi:hypothetical protein
MFRGLSFIVICVLFVDSAFGQPTQPGANTVDLTMGIARDQFNFSGAYVHNWRLGTRQKFEVGLGGRMTACFGSNQYYSTAPASITSGGAPFGEPTRGNVDSLLVASTQIFAINAMFNFGYRLTRNLTVGFNIDLIGYSFGGQNKGTYVNGKEVQSVLSNPTAFNVLLIGNNDRGTLNSEFYVKYRLNDRWSVKGGLQHLFTEYTTVTKVQQYPEPNDRFRDKSNLFSIGVSMRL